MANTKTIKLIKRAYYLLDVANTSRSNYRDKIFQLAAAGERRHRRGMGPWHCTVADAARLFTVRNLTKYAAMPDRVPTVADLLTLRDDVALCAMVAENYRAVILDALKEVDMMQLIDLDYVRLVNGCADDFMKAAA